MNLNPKTIRSICAILTIMVLSLLSFQTISAQVKAWEGTITIPTYGWEDDVNPKFWAMEAGAKGATTVKASITYPYNMQDHLSRKLEDVTYKAIFLENEYLKITCLPELGGRLHSIFDKSTGEDAFHLNDVIKPSMIAMRGAFISGGIEWNAGPQVHTVTILSPVDVLYGENEDGSAYIEVSNLEKSLRTQWTVRVTLHPGKSVLDEDIRIYNPTDAMNPYYFWNCTAFPQLEGTRFIYPMKMGTDHFGVRYFDWPVNDGKDISWTKNYADASSVFAVDCAYDFFGAYDVNLDRGIVQVADHNEHQGKKAWTWGQGEYGRVSMDNLGDTNPEYIEVQSGPLQTQSDYGSLAPGASVSWKEYWYPVHGLNTGFEFATEKVAVQTKHSAGKIGISLISTEDFKGATCLIKSGGKEIGRKTFSLSPNSSVEVEMDKGAHDTVTICLENNEGEVLAKFLSPLPYSPVNPLGLPSYLTVEDEKLNVQENYLKAQKFDRALDRLNARKYYQAALSLDSLHLASLRDLAILDFESGQYEEAESRLTLALNQIPNDDGLAWYFLGLCKLKNGDTEGAAKCGFKASRCIGTVARGYGLVGTSRMLEKRFGDAEKYFSMAKQADKNDPLLYHNHFIAVYADGDKDKALALASKRMGSCPTELVPRFMKAILEQDAKGVEVIRDFVGEDDFEILEASLVFSRLGMQAEAVEVLKMGCIDPIQQEDQNHLILYQLAYLSDQSGEAEKASAYLKKAADNYQDFILASRPEMEEALLYALDKDPGDALAAYQLGNMYGNFGRLCEAEEYWALSAESDASISITWRNLGLYYWVMKDDHDKSESCYRNAIKARPYDQTLYRDLAKMLIDKQKTGEAIILLENMKYKGTLRSDVIIDLADYYLQDERYDDCINLLSSVPYFVNWEGSAVTWSLFNMANVKKGIQLYEDGKSKQALRAMEKALTWPENLGVGRSTRTEEAMAWFWKGKILLSMGKGDEAVQAWKKGASSTGGSETQEKYREICSELLK